MFCVDVGGSNVVVKTEVVDSDDMSEHAYDDKPDSSTLGFF